MKSSMVMAAAVGACLVAFTSHATAQVASGINYFDAQIFDGVAGGKAGTPIPANTTFADGTPFTEHPFSADPETESNWDGFPEADDFDTTGNWTNGGGGSQGGEDGLWRRRSNDAFGNKNSTIGTPTAGTVGDILDARGSASSGEGSNNELTAVLKTTVDVEAADQGQMRSVWAFFWGGGTADDGRGGGPWQLAACVDCDGVNPNNIPVFRSGGPPDPASHTFMAYDLTGLGAGGAGAGDGTSPFVTTDAALTSSANFGGDGGSAPETGDRALWAAFLGNVELGAELSVNAWHGPYVQSEQENSGNFRTWYDGIGYGPVVDGLEARPIVPEPASAALLLLALSTLGAAARRRG